MNIKKRMYLDGVQLVDTVLLSRLTDLTCDIQEQIEEMRQSKLTGNQNYNIVPIQLYRACTTTSKKLTKQLLELLNQQDKEPDLS